MIEYAESGNLFHFIQAVEFLQLKEKDLKELIIGIAQGLAWIHQLLIVHGDFKAQTANLIPKICDFGLMRLPHNSIIATLSKVNTNATGSC